MNVVEDPATIEMFDRACRATTRDEATTSVAEVTAMRLRAEPKESVERATQWARSAIAYWSGYFADHVRTRVEGLYETEHPIMGGRRGLSPKTLFIMGMELSKANVDKFPWPLRPPPYPDEP